jgi:hypothetical protein
MQRKVTMRRKKMNPSTPTTPEVKERLDQVVMQKWLSRSESDEIGLMDLVLLEGLTEQNLAELKN